MVPKFDLFAFDWFQLTIFPTALWTTSEYEQFSTVCWIFIVKGSNFLKLEILLTLSQYRIIDNNVCVQEKAVKKHLWYEAQMLFLESNADKLQGSVWQDNKQEFSLLINFEESRGQQPNHYSKSCSL